MNLPTNIITIFVIFSRSSIRGPKFLSFTNSIWTSAFSRTQKKMVVWSYPPTLKQLKLICMGNNLFPSTVFWIGAFILLYMNLYFISPLLHFSCCFSALVHAFLHNRWKRIKFQFLWKCSLSSIIFYSLWGGWGPGGGGDVVPLEIKRRVLVISGSYIKKK